jgi:hypothetical protein
MASWLLILDRQYDTRTAGPLFKARNLLVVLAAVVAVSAGLAVWLTGLGSSGKATVQPADDPVVFLRGIVRGIAGNDYEAIWPSLHPAQQCVATRGLYVRCEQRDPVVGRLDGITVIRALDQRIAVAGAAGNVVDSKAVTFRLKLTEATGRTSGVVTVHAVAVEGHWRWILTPSRFEVYRSGVCPTTVPPSSPSSSA